MNVLSSVKENMFCYPGDLWNLRDNYEDDDIKIFWCICLDNSRVSYNIKEANDENINPFMHNVVKWPNMLWKSCDVNTARFLKYIWPFYNIMHERVKLYWNQVMTYKKCKSHRKMFAGAVPY